MVPDGIRERFDLYRKWFKTFLIREFMNLPTKYQERFLILLETFTQDCKKIFSEGKKVKERIIKIEVEAIEEPDNKEENFIVIGRSPETDRIRINFPASMPQPKIGATLHHTVYSLNEILWYSSKEELITKS